MLASITPLGERGRARRWGATVSWYALGSTVGGALLGITAGLLGSAAPLPRQLALLLGVLVCLAALVVDGRRLSIPSWFRQVDEDWLARYRGWVIGAGFGVQLGLGVVTIVTTASVYAVAALAALTGSAPAGLAVGAAFGLVRALPVLATWRVVGPAGLARLHQRLAAGASRARAAVLVTLGLVALALCAAGL